MIIEFSLLKLNQRQTLTFFLNIAWFYQQIPKFDNNLDGIQDDKNNDEIVTSLRNAINSFPKIDKI
jgi:hypothetical protein